MSTVAGVMTSVVELTEMQTGKCLVSGVKLASDRANACTSGDQLPELGPAAAASEQDTSPLLSLPIARSSLPFGSLPVPSGGGPLSAAAAPAPLDSLGSIINALSLCTSPQQLQGFFLDLQAQGICQQVSFAVSPCERAAAQCICEPLSGVLIAPWYCCIHLQQGLSVVCCPCLCNAISQHVSEVCGDARCKHRE